MSGDYCCRGTSVSHVMHVCCVSGPWSRWRKSASHSCRAAVVSRTLKENFARAASSLEFASGCRVLSWRDHCLCIARATCPDKNAASRSTGSAGKLSNFLSRGTDRGIFSWQSFMLYTFWKVCSDVLVCRFSHAACSERIYIVILLIGSLRRVALVGW